MAMPLYFAHLFFEINAIILSGILAMLSTIQPKNDQAETIITAVVLSSANIIAPNDMMMGSTSVVKAAATHQRRYLQSRLRRRVAKKSNTIIATDMIIVVRNILLCFTLLSRANITPEFSLA